METPSVSINLPQDDDMDTDAAPATDELSDETPTPKRAARHVTVADDAPVEQPDATSIAREMQSILELRKQAEALMAEASSIRSRAVAEADTIIEQSMSTAEQVVREGRQSADVARVHAEEETEAALRETREKASRALAVAEMAQLRADGDIKLAGESAQAAAQRATADLETSRDNFVDSVESAWEKSVSELERLTSSHLRAAVEDIDAWREEYINQAQAEWQERMLEVEATARRLNRTIQQSGQALSQLIEEFSGLREEMAPVPRRRAQSAPEPVEAPVREPKAVIPVDVIARETTEVEATEEPPAVEPQPVREERWEPRLQVVSDDDSGDRPKRAFFRNR